MQRGYDPIWANLNAMHQSQGTSATHSLPERERVCDQVYIRLNGCQVMVDCLNYVGGKPNY